MREKTTALVARQEPSMAIFPFEDIERMAIAMAKSKLFGLASPEQAITLMLLAQAEGLHPAAAARDYHIIQGRPSLKADTMLARFIQAGGKVEWHALSDDQAAATFSHPQGGSVRLDWTLDRAKRAGLLKNDMWAKYPRQMLRARLVSDGVRTIFPGVIAGLYAPEEILDGYGPTAGPAHEGAAHMQAQWADSEPANGPPPGAPVKATITAVEVVPDQAKPATARRQALKDLILRLGLPPEQITVCLTAQGWPIRPSDLSEDQFQALCNELLPAWAEAHQA